MQIVVRTPHGDADVSIAWSAPSTTLGEVIGAVTGQAVPRLALVDGRAVDATTPLELAGLLLGSLVTTEPALAETPSEADVTLVQIAGSGVGRSARLTPGRYRIGPGRRATASELDIAPVDAEEFEILVEPTTAASEVTIVPIGADVALDGTALSAPSPWRTGTLSARNRAFELVAPAVTSPPRMLPSPDPDGTAAFSRPPRRRSAPPRRPVVDALEQSTTAAPTLWERRPDHPDAFVLSFGMRSDASGTTTVDVDLGAERAVALAGSERFRSALARTLLVEAVTLHGPADLDVIVMTSPDRCAAWDWAKWLPHIDTGGSPAIWSSAQDISAWARATASFTDAAATPWMASHLTIVVLDDPALWNRRESPLRSIVSNPPKDVRCIALCDDAAHAPAICTAVISETADGGARFHSFTRTDDIEGIRAALTETDVAARVARSLAPLVDVDLVIPVTHASTTVEQERIDLLGLDLIGLTDADGVLERWALDEPCPTAMIGRHGDQPVHVPVVDGVTVVAGPSMGDAFDVAVTALVDLCTHRSPDALWVVPLVIADPRRAEVLWRLPHATDPHSEEVAVEPRRLVARLRSLLDDPDGPERIVVVVEASGRSPASSDGRLLAELSQQARSLPGLTLLVITDRVDDVVSADTTVVVERHDRRRTGQHRRVARIATANAPHGVEFDPLQPTSASVTTLEVTPYVVGRSLSPLERRLEQRRAALHNVPDPSFDPVVQLLCDAEARRTAGSIAPRRARTAVPPPLPTRVDLDELFATSPGDGVPLGLVDDPHTGATRPRWWELGSGSLLLFGSRRSGIEQVLVTIVLGLADRFAPDDVRLLVIESSAQRRRAFDGIDHAVHSVATDHFVEVAMLFDEIDAELERGPTADGPPLVVLIGDLPQLRRQFLGQTLATRIDDVLTRAAMVGSGVDVVAYAGDLAGAGPFGVAATTRLAGATSNREELAALGVDHPDELDGIVGRCRSLPDGALVQLATTEVPLDELFANRSTGATR